MITKTYHASESKIIINYHVLNVHDEYKLFCQYVCNDCEVYDN